MFGADRQFRQFWVQPVNLERFCRNSSKPCYTARSRREDSDAPIESFWRLKIVEIRPVLYGPMLYPTIVS